MKKSLLLILFCAAVAGCDRGPRVYPIDGKLVFSDGTPVREAKIEFRSVEGQSIARAASDQEGKFRLTTRELYDGAIAGKHRVIVFQKMVATSEDMREHAQHMRVLDKKYADYSTSNLEYEVTPTGRQEIVITLED